MVKCPLTNITRKLLDMNVSVANLGHEEVNYVSFYLRDDGHKTTSNSDFETGTKWENHISRPKRSQQKYQYIQ